MYPNRQQLLESIHSDMKLDKAFFLKIYADEITWPGSADKAIKKLEEAGCSNARKYYDMTVSEYQRKRDEELRPIAKQIRKQWEKEWEELKKGSEERRRQEVQSLTREELTELCQKLLQKGIIKSPEQFVTAVFPGQ